MPNPTEQKPDDLDIIQMVHKISESTKTRRESKRKSTKINLSESIQKLQTNINTTFHTSHKSISKTHRHRIETLTGLLKRKASIEASMMASTKKIERALQAAHQEFHLTLEGRLKDMGPDVNARR